ncbi:MAG: hypothetical protein WC527_07205 [Candidatus Margulisiibacteriota bacterium]
MSPIRSGNVVIYDYAGVRASHLEAHAEKLASNVALYQMRLPRLFSERTINTCVVPDRVFRSWVTPESDAFKPQEARTAGIPSALYGISDDMIKFPASLLNLVMLEGWEKEGISHEILHAGSRRIVDAGYKCGIALCGFDGKIDSLDKYLNEGLTEHIRMSLGGAVVRNRYYPIAMAVGEIIKRVGDAVVLSAYFGEEVSPFIAAVEGAFGTNSYSAIREVSRQVVKGNIDPAKLMEVLGK